MRDSKAWCALIALAAAPATALAQPAPKAAPAPAAKPPPKAVQGVTVTGAAPDVQNQIDRRTYTLGKDLQATTGSIADALRNVPSVDVDLQGNLSLRGDRNVTILIDGKPAPMFEGAGRADALQQLPADQIERVEVITNPSAAFNPEGSGGIINLVTKKGRGAGPTGSVYGTAGSQGLKRAGATLGYNTKRLGATLQLSESYQRNKQQSTDDRMALGPDGAIVEDSEFDTVGRNLTRVPNARLNLSYQLDPKTQLTGSAAYNQVLVYGYPFQHFQVDDAAGRTLSLLNRQGARRFEQIDTSLTGGWRRSFTGTGHELTLDVIRNQSRPRDRIDWTTAQVLPPAVNLAERYIDGSTLTHSEVKLAYNRPMPNGASLKTGYEWKRDDNDYNHLDAFGPGFGALAFDPARTNQFTYRQTVNTGYATFERSFGDLSAQAGLRLENVSWTLDQLTTGQTVDHDYFRAYPSLHLSYKLDDGQKLSAAYSRRVQRPPPFLLNPLITRIDPKNAQQGNPDLGPQDTQSFELGYERRHRQDLFLATLYYRRITGVFSPVLRNIGDGTYLLTFENLGSAQSAGLELVANGRLTPKLTYNANTTFYWNQLDTGDIVGGLGRESIFTVGGRANLNWQVRPDDLVQVNASMQSRFLYAQGTQSPIYTLNLGWRHKFDERTTATLTIQDLLATSRGKRQFDTPTLRERALFDPVSRAVILRLDYRFGGTKGRPGRDPGFEYETAAPQTPG